MFFFCKNYAQLSGKFSLWRVYLLLTFTWKMKIRHQSVSKVSIFFYHFRNYFKYFKPHCRLGKKKICEKHGQNHTASCIKNFPPLIFPIPVLHHFLWTIPESLLAILRPFQKNMYTWQRNLSMSMLISKSLFPS